MSARDRSPGERLAQARREKGVREWRDVRRTELAEAAGIDASTVTLYEKGRSGIGEDVLAKLCQFLGVTPEYVRYGVTTTIPPMTSVRGKPRTAKPPPAGAKRDLTTTQ